MRVRQPGKVLKKHETDPIVQTADPVQMFPAHTTTI